MKLSDYIQSLRLLQAQCGDAEVFVYCNNGQWKQPDAAARLWNEFASTMGPDDLPAGADLPEDVFVEIG